MARSYCCSLWLQRKLTVGLLLLLALATAATAQTRPNLAPTSLATKESGNAATASDRNSCSPDTGSQLAAALRLPRTATPMPNCVRLGPHLNLTWGVSGDVVTFALAAKDLPPRTSYVGIGLSEQGSMHGADIAFLNATRDGWRLVDTHATGFSAPRVDARQDLRLLALEARTGGLVAAWQRRLVPCDKQNLPIGLAPLHVIWAYGDGSYHGTTTRGSQLVWLLGKQPAAQAPARPVALLAANSSSSTNSSSTIRVLELTFPVPAIPTKTTTYLVQYFKLPANAKYHIVRYEPIVRSPHLHHGVLYSCPPEAAAKVLAMPSMGPFDRFKEGMLCENFYMVRAEGRAEHQDGFGGCCCCCCRYPLHTH
jgi:DOMON domain/Copper type II ascorbate-dependent monooxygenase, N-terminal domain